MPPENPQGSALTRALTHGPAPFLVVYAIAVSFTTYFCMYAFRKPFSAATYTDAGGAALPFFGTDLTLKSAFVTSQLIGYALSKYIGIKVCSEITRRQRAIALVGLIIVAELALLAFAVLPTDYKFVALFVNGLPLGMVWGLVVWYLEGRRTSELLLAGLSASFILSSGIVKDVGLWLMDQHAVSQWMMPAMTGLIFLPLFLVAVWLLNQMPDPSAADEAERSHREPMDGGERLSFIRQFAPGLIFLFIAYFFLTAFRDFRDNFGKEVFNYLGYGDSPGIFSRSETWVAFGVLVPLAMLFMIRNSRVGLLAALGIMLIGSVLMGVATAALQAGAISGLTWMILIGLGAYLAYVPYGSVLFDRLIACTRVTGTAVFAIYVADALGYTGSVALYFAKDLVASKVAHGPFLIGFSYGMSALGITMLTLASIYFWRVSRPSKGDAD